jgi:hypothetical protein
MCKRPAERGVCIFARVSDYFVGDVDFVSLAVPAAGGALALLGVEPAGAAGVAVVSLAGAAADFAVGDGAGLIVELPVPAVVAFLSRPAPFTVDSASFASCKCCSSVGSVFSANAFTSGSFADFAIDRKSRTTLE